MGTPRRLLVIDDEPFFRQVVKRILAAEGWTVLEASTSAEARELLGREPDLEAVFLDVLLGEENGIDLLRTYRAAGGSVPVIVMTALDDVDTAVAAMKAGAYDFLVKPVSRERLVTALAHVSERLALLNENRALKRRVREDSFSRTLVGESPAMGALFSEMERVVEADIPVCLLGETGTGKELVARWLHEHGPRSKGPFVDLNCAAIPETLIESELFGHEKGAFTNAIGRRIGKLEQAHGGTLFLDELGEMALSTQARLLRVLQERTLVRVGGTDVVPFDTRLVSATQRDLHEAVRDGRFREDLYFRVVVYPIRLPALRERKEDLAVLVHHFIRRFRNTTGRPVEGVAPDALAHLERYDWPGNVRELQNAVHRAVVAARGPFLGAADFPDLGFPSLPRPAARPAPVLSPADAAAPRNAATLQPLVTLEDHERAAITQALAAAGGSIKVAADRLRVARSTLYRRIRQLGIAAGEKG